MVYRQSPKNDQGDPMSDVSVEPKPAERAVAAQLSTLDRFLPVWIGAAMVLGIALG